MSDLQIILIAIGALIIAAVLILNWWQERKFHQQIEKGFIKLHDDALLDEPSLDVTKLYQPADEFKHDPEYDPPTIEQSAFAISESADEDMRELPSELISTPVGLPVGAVDEYDSLNKNSTEEVYIDTVYSELSHKVNESAHLSNDKYSANAKHSAAEPIQEESKPARHEEIKAIFNEVFSNAGTGYAADKPAGDSQNASDALTESLNEPVLSMPAMLHAQMDLTAILYLAAESTVRELNLAINGMFDGYEKPVFIHILDSNKQWGLLQEAADKLQNLNNPVSRLACSIQLADRAGAVSRSALNRFQLAVESLGLDINAHVEWQSSGDALAAANALDAFCIEVDKSMGFHLVHGENGAFTGTKLRGLVEAQGLVLDADGTFKYFDEATLKQGTNPKLPSFLMFNRDQHPFSPEMLRTSVVKAVTFQLDIPHVKHCAEAFNQMVKIARQMEIGLHAVLVDDNNRPLNEIQIEKIRQQLKVIHAKLLVRGIVPGSDSALRLFS